MRRHSFHLSKRLFFVPLFLLCGVFLLLHLSHRDEKQFQKITEQLFLDELTCNTLDLHYTLASPTDFGITSYEPTLSCFSPEDVPLIQETLSKKIQALKKINTAHLPPADAFLHGLLLRSLENSLALNLYPYYTEPLSPTSGMHSQLLILLAEYQFRCIRDIEDYLALLDQTDEYFASLLVYEQKKRDEGLLMPAAFLQETIRQCEQILTEDILSREAHFLQTTFRARVEQLLSRGLLSKEQGEEYTKQHNRLLQAVMLPSYQNLAQGLSALKDDRILPRGLGAYPDGKLYYEHLLISQTGSRRSIPDVKKMLTEQLATDIHAIQTIRLEHPSYSEELCANPFPLTDSKEILKDLQARMQADFPPLPQEQTSIALKSVVPEMEDLCAPAFYMTPPLDDTEHNTIYINHGKTPQGLELYTTLAHEGFPGHLYQSVYCNRYSQMQGDNPVRHILWYGGYLEGWAIYGEMRSYDYAAQLLTEHGQPDAALQTRLIKHTRSLQLCLYSLLDIMIHYDNATFSEVYDWLNKIGAGNADTIRRIYHYIVQEPCNYLKYYLGYLEILSLQNEAKTKWGETYTDYGFHCFFLNCGPSDFIGLREQLAQTDVPLTPPLSEPESHWPQYPPK